ncbi:TPA: MFS transporter [Pseudomonas aeruginosa]
MPASLLVLALSAFAIGTTEFVIMGLLPQVAGDLRVSIPSAGWLISGYAFAVAFGAPLMAMATARLERKKALLALMGIFIVGNLLCAVAANYGLLMLARIVTALCHGAFFGIGSVVAASLVAPNRRASAVALMFTGLTLANVLGVPLGTALGQEAGWRATFWVVTLIGVVAFVGLARVLPNDREEEKVDLRQEMSALKNPSLWLALGTTVLFAAMALVSALFSWTSQALLPAEITLFFWAAAAFAAVPALQVNVVRVGHAAPNLVATLNIGAFNVGNALGAWVGGSVIDHGLGLTRVPLAAAALAALALLATLIAFSGNGRAQAQPVLD